MGGREGINDLRRSKYSTSSLTWEGKNRGGYGKGRGGMEGMNRNEGIRPPLRLRRGRGRSGGASFIGLNAKYG